MRMKTKKRLRIPQRTVKTLKSASDSAGQPPTLCALQIHLLYFTRRTRCIKEIQRNRYCACVMQVMSCGIMSVFNSNWQLK